MQHWVAVESMSSVLNKNESVTCDFYLCYYRYYLLCLKHPFPVKPLCSFYKGESYSYFYLWYLRALNCRCDLQPSKGQCNQKSCVSDYICKCNIKAKVYQLTMFHIDFCFCVCSLHQVSFTCFMITLWSWKIHFCFDPL